MTLKDFITKYNGQFKDWDGHYGAQCVDLYRFYVDEVWNKPQTPAVKSAYQIFDSLDTTQYDKFTSGEIKVGDVMIWTNKYGKDGHVAIVENPSDTQTFVAFGQNDPVGSVSKLSRYKYSNLKGWFRPKNPLAKTFMAVTVVANKNNSTTLPAKLETIKQRMISLSDGKFEPVFNIIKTEFSNIPLSPPVPGMPNAVDVNWYRKNITPLATGQATMFLINPEDYPNGNTYGYMTWGDTGRPVRMEMAKAENDPSFEDVFIHELGGHALQFLTGQPDITHALLLQNPPKFKELMQYVDQLKLQQALVKIK